jgi:hypothetical protein
MRARHKASTKEVWQYTGPDKPIPLWVYRHTEYRPNGESKGLYLVRGADKQRVDHLDWLIRNLDGAPEWMPDRDFRQSYAIMEDLNP